MSFTRVWAVATKEMRLNMRFPLEYLASNFISPLKSSVLMFILYRGLLGEDRSLGMLNGNNYQVYVLVGTTCHSLLMSSLSVFKSRMSAEKYWQTINATLVSPASIFETVLGFALGSGSINVLISVIILTLTCLIFPISLMTYFAALAILLIISFLGYGLGIIGATFTLCWEGKTFLYEYVVQGVVFLSCFYYPIETFPSYAHPLIKLLPTYWASTIIHELFNQGFAPDLTLMTLILVLNTAVILILPTIFLDWSIKRFGIVGY